ncbi:hypothetical protein SAMN02745116_00598 [Pilibacter termitis]|uniref:Accessory gene regulator B n=1 Tax=Pilibacter termitis TaxID=263852 RepID=A0A1T4LAW4_9ENTE|nr:hypothetical protein [Pilibacter termitis]SJZ51909.1 hypothetical protein SAMN02745116_00598 [Pilibacter termitis]
MLKIPENRQAHKLLRYELATMQVIIVVFSVIILLTEKENTLGYALLAVSTIISTIFEVSIRKEAEKEQNK